LTSVCSYLKLNCWMLEEHGSVSHLTEATDRPPVDSDRL